MKFPMIETFFRRWGKKKKTPGGPTNTHTHTPKVVIYTEQTSIRMAQDKKVNKHLVMKINDTNHTQALTHFSLFNCNG